MRPHGGSIDRYRDGCRCEGCVACYERSLQWGPFESWKQRGERELRELAERRAAVAAKRAAEAEREFNRECAQFEYPGPFIISEGRGREAQRVIVHLTRAELDRVFAGGKGA